MGTIRLVIQGITFFIILLSNSAVYALNGYGEIKGIYYQNQNDLYELRSRLLFEDKVFLEDWVSFNLGGKIYGMLSNREERNNDFFVQLDNASINFYFPSVEIKCGYSRVFWGKLDYLSPIDVVNPPILSELLFTDEKRETKLPVLLLLGSLYFADINRLDLILVPFYQKGIYDAFNEQYSPFNPIHLPLPLIEKLPSKSIENMEYGGRVSSSVQTVDFSLYYYSGFQDFLSYRLEHALPPNNIEANTFRTNMFGADFECISGGWGIRGEGAFFTGMGYQQKDVIDYKRGNSLTAGLSFDRNRGESYLNVSALYKKIFIDEDLEEYKDEITVIVNIKRTFTYETKMIELFSIYNLMSASSYFNGMVSVSIFENHWLDFSFGLFNGGNGNVLSKLIDSDFFLVKWRYNF
jgi:hypothetical protein